MKRAVILAVLVIVMLASSCQFITGENPASIPVTSPPTETSPLSWLLRAVPGSADMIMYSDIPTLSAGEGQAIPSRQASLQDKIGWLNTFQRQMFAGMTGGGLAELWGFDGVDVQGVLTFWPPLPQITILGGALDTTAFRDKMRSYRYTEESYLDCTLISGVPVPTGNLTASLAGLMPRAMGVIDGLEVEGDTFNLIIMSGADGASDPLPAKNHVQAVLQAFRDKTTLAYGDDSLTELATKIGRVGSAFLTSRPVLEEMLQNVDPSIKAKLREFVGPGELTHYNEFAITYRKEGGSELVDFVLAYDTAASAQANAETLRVRLAEARSAFFPLPLSRLWEVKDIAAEGRFLRTTVALLPLDTGKTINLVAMIYAGDFLFLLPGKAEAY